MTKAELKEKVEKAKQTRAKEKAGYDDMIELVNSISNTVYKLLPKSLKAIIDKYKEELTK